MHVHFGPFSVTILEFSREAREKRMGGQLCQGKAAKPVDRLKPNRHILETYI